MKSIFLVLLVLLVSCQREIRNEVGVGYNKELIIPPTNDLPLPNSADENTTNSEISNNPVIESILNQTNANEANPNIKYLQEYVEGYEKHLKNHIEKKFVIR